jgi:hypothetical protein
MAALASYSAVVAEFAPLVALTFALLIFVGVAVWLAERPMQPRNHESAVDTLRDGVYWAVVTMTTIGTAGRNFMDARERRAGFDPVDLHCLENDRRASRR